MGNNNLIGMKVKVLYDFPLDNEVFEITNQEGDNIEVTGDFSAGTHKVSQSSWISQSKIKEFVKN